MAYFLPEGWRNKKITFLLLIRGRLTTSCNIWVQIINIPTSVVDFANYASKLCSITRTLCNTDVNREKIVFDAKKLQRLDI